MSNEALTALAGVLVGGLLSYLTALRVADRSATHAQRAVEAEHRRAVRDARLERMRSNYAVLLRATRALEAQARAAETTLIEYDTETIDSEAHDAMARVRDVEPSLLLESDGPEMLDAFRVFNAKHFDYSLALVKAKKGDHKGLFESRRALADAIEAVIAKARADVQAAESQS